MSASDFSTIYNELDKLRTRVSKLEEQLAALPCTCEEDWTDGTAICEQCGRERK